MTKEPFNGEIKEGVSWFITQVQAIARWLWAIVFEGRQKTK